MSRHKGNVLFGGAPVSPYCVTLMWYHPVERLLCVLAGKNQPAAKSKIFRRGIQAVCWQNTVAGR